MMVRSIDGDSRVHTALKVAAVVAVALAALLLSPAAALAQRMHGGGGHSGGGGGLHQFNGTGSFRAAHPGGFGHGHRGHFGGAVVIGSGFGLWYPAFYPYPYYGYAYPYDGYPYAYDPSAGVPGNSMPPPAQNWYYCDAAGAYYPYVASCPGGWRVVPATPAPAQ